MPTTHLDERALAQRVSYFEITDDDLARLGSLRSVAEGWSDGIVAFRVTRPTGDVKN